MGWLKTAGRALFRRREVERELDDEMRFHLEKAQEALVARGVPPEEARLAALREFGGVEQHKEECRDERGISAFEDLGQDLRRRVDEHRRVVIAQRVCEVHAAHAAAASFAPSTFSS